MRRIRDEIESGSGAARPSSRRIERRRRPDLARRAAAEGLAAFALVFAGCGAIVADAEYGGALGAVGIALVFGLVIMVMVYATGHLSGAHINPAVTLAFTLTRHFPAARGAAYIAAQLRRGGRWRRSACSRSGPTSRRELGATMPSVGVGSALVYEAAPDRLPDVRDHGRRHRHPRGRRRRGDRDRRHGRPRRPLRRPGHRRLDEPGPLVRAGARRRRVADFWIYVVGPLGGAALGALAYQLVRGQQAEAGPTSSTPRL